MGGESPGAIILIAEGFADTRMMPREAPEMYGFHVVAAANRLETTSAARRERPHLILGDLYMLALGGFGMTCLLREHPGTRGVPIAAVSAYDSGDDHAVAEDTSATAHLTKPADLESLHDLVRRLPPDS